LKKIKFDIRKNMNNKERIDLAQWAMDYTLKCGSDQAAVSISNRREIEIEYRDKKLETIDAELA
jgi:hypothetical protein